MGSMRVRKGDKVVVIAGKDKGKEGKVMEAYPHKQRVLVEQVAVAKKTKRPTQQNPQGGIEDREQPIHVSNVMVICPKCNKPSRLGAKREDGKKVRVCKKCQAEF